MKENAETEINATTAITKKILKSMNAENSKTPTITITTEVIDVHTSQFLNLVNK